MTWSLRMSTWTFFLMTVVTLIWVGMVGAVASVTPNSLDVMTKSEGMQSVRLDNRTEYMKWITHKPWQQENSAKRESVGAGSCVDVQLRSDQGAIAKRVWINADGAGTLYDPCRAIR